MDTHYRTECQERKPPLVYTRVRTAHDDEETEMWTALLCVSLVAAFLGLVYIGAAQGAEIAETGVQIVLSGL